MRATARFRVASVTKPFTAVVVLGLVADGILSLEDTVERWLPGRLPDGAGSRMTIRMLLGHRSGLVNAGSGSGPITVVGAPGSFRYANGNYELLGAIVEAATGSTFGEQLAARVLRPVALTHTELPSSSLPIAGLAHGYSPAVVRTGGPRLDLTAVASGLSAPAAGLVSSADDLAAFAAALFGGDLVPRGLFTAMATAGDVGGSSAVGYSAYGLGLMRFNSPCGDAWGHRGRTLGYTAYLLATADGRRTVIALLNDGELPDPLTSRVDALVTRALCA
jgi:D-alanyl-D-alanine carboxypeptidase